MKYTLKGWDGTQRTIEPHEGQLEPRKDAARNYLRPWMESGDHVSFSKMDEGRLHCCVVDSTGQPTDAVCIISAAHE